MQRGGWTIDVDPVAFFSSLFFSLVFLLFLYSWIYFDVCIGIVRKPNRVRSWSCGFRKPFRIRMKISKTSVFLKWHSIKQLIRWTEGAPYSTHQLVVGSTYYIQQAFLLSFERRAWKLTFSNSSFPSNCRRQSLTFRGSSLNSIERLFNQTIQHVDSQEWRHNPRLLKQCLSA